MKALLCMIALSLPVIGVAQESSCASERPGWRLEPAAVFGVKLGAALTRDAVPRCGNASTKPPLSGILVCATQEPTANWVAIEVPTVRDFEDGVITLKAGAAVGIHLPMAHTSYARIKALFFAQYGEPTHVIQDEVRTVSGTVFPSETLVWDGATTELTLIERSRLVERSAASFVHKPSYRSAKGYGTCQSGRAVGVGNAG